MSLLAKGMLAPLHISVLSYEGTSVSLRDTLGSPTVIYFYPRDNTPGCTTEACSFRDTFAEFEKHDITVVGVSADSPTSHNKFKTKHALPFELWSDPEKKLIAAFGALKEKKMFGKTVQGIRRVTFALDATGKIIALWQDVSPATHPEEVLTFFRKYLS